MDFFRDAPWFTWLLALGALTCVGMIFSRWLPIGRPRKTIAERTQNGRTLLFDKKEELRRVGVFNRVQGEFAVLLAVLLVTAKLYTNGVIRGFAGGILLVVVSVIVWFISRPPHILRHAPDRIYGTKDALLVMRRGVTENIPYSHIVENETFPYAGIVWYGYAIILHLTEGRCLQFFMTTPSRPPVPPFGMEPEFEMSAPFVENLHECIRRHNERSPDTPSLKS
ncbi:MAG: hypothetical protein LBD68_02380 [Zoogloeaceae bacterium]|jgi:hypothetical protein|nr:hypothetical protein [Zoogloeaceae bacterium]